MPGLPELSKDLVIEYNITKADAYELIQFINRDIIERIARGEVMHIDQFGSFHAEDGKVWFNPSKYMLDYIKQYGSVKVKKEKKRGDRWKDLHKDYLSRLNKDVQ